MVRLVLIEVVHHNAHEELEAQVDSEEHVDVDVDGHVLQAGGQTSQ